MCTGNSDRCVVIAHDLSEELGPGEHRDAFGCRTGEFRVVRMDSCRIDNDLDRFFNIRSPLTIENLGSALFKRSGKRAFLSIGTGHCEVFLQQDFRKTAHADAADTDKMDMQWFVKVYLIHIIVS